MAISVGDAVLKIGVDKKDFDRGMQGIGASIKKHHKAIGIGMTALGGTILALGVKSLMTASNIEEMTAKLETVFGDLSDGVKEWAETTAREMGRSRFAFMEMAAGLQDTFVPMGIARDEAAELSKKLTVLAVDVASFNNKLDKDVIRDFQSALVGNTETVRKYGIVITAVGVEQEILNQGWVENKKDITEAMKVQARLNLIMAGTTDAQGDAIRTAGSFANQMKALKARIEEVFASIGGHLLPIITSLVTKVADVVEKVVAWTKEHPELARVITLTTGAIGILMLVLGPLLFALPQIVSAFAIMRGFMLTRLIPSIVSVTAALWAKVAALLAAMAAMGPAGWAMAAATMVLIGTGLVFVVKKARDATSQFTGKVKDYVPEAGRANSITKEWSDNLSELEAVTRKISDAETELTQVTDKLNEPMKEMANRQVFMTAPAEELAKRFNEQTLAIDGLTREARNYVRVLLEMETLNDEELKFLRAYKKLLGEATEAEKEYREELEETTKQLEEKAEAQERATEMIEDAIEEMQYERSEAGRLGISIDDVIVALHLMGKSNEYIADTLITLGDEQGNVLAVMDAFGLKAIQIAEILGMETDAVRSLIDSLEDLEEAAPTGAKRLPGEEAFAGMGEIGTIPFSELTDEQIKEGWKRGGHFWVPEKEDMDALRERMEGGLRENLAAGGIAMHPITANIAERKPEAVIPLDRLEGMLGNKMMTIIFEQDGRQVARTIMPYVVGEIRLRTGVHI